MRFILMIVCGLTLAACGGGSPAPQAGQTQISGDAASAAVNAIRAQAGVAGVRRNAALDAAAKAHANDMAAQNFFSHRGSNGSTLGQRVRAQGYKWCTVAENVAKGYQFQDGAIESWRVSSGHYRNMVNGTVREFGLANAGRYWVMVLAAQRC